jgi:hypothetical protein
MISGDNGIRFSRMESRLRKIGSEVVSLKRLVGVDIAMKAAILTLLLFH